MFPRLHFAKFITLSFAFHALMIALVLFLIRPDRAALPVSIPVNIVNIPKEALKKLPPLEQTPKPVIPHPVIPQKTIPVPVPKPSDRTGVLTVPKTSPSPKTSPAPSRPPIDSGGTDEQRKGSMDSGNSKAHKGGPLPFLSQQDINELGQKGHEHDRQHDPLSEDTEAFKFLPYGRNMIAKLNNNLRFPELAAITGLQGDVLVVYEIKKDGSIGDITITKSSGYKILDDEVIRTIRETAPFQPLPDEWHKDRLIVPLVGIFRIYEKRIE